MDILDSAQKQINDAAKQIDPQIPSSGAPPEPPPAPVTPTADPVSTPAIPPEPPKELLKEEAILPEKTGVTPAPIAIPPADLPASPPIPPPDTPEIKPPEVLQTTTFGAVPTEPPKETPPAPSPASPPKKGGGGRGVLLAGLLILLVALPIGVYYVSRQQQQLAEIRSKAAVPAGNNCCGDSTYANGKGGVCTTPDDWNAGFYACASRGCQSCRGEAAVCGNKQCESGETQTTCPADCTSTGQVPTATPTPRGATPPPCAGPLQSCETRSCCTGQNLVCQGVAGSRVCQVTTPGQCPGGSCTGYIGFKCNVLANGQCRENPKVFTSAGAAASYAGTCGQVDQVCVGGSRENQLCGDFSIFSSSCGSGGPTSTPRPTSTPTPISGQCTRIKVYKNNAVVVPSTLKASDSVVLAVAGTNATKGRIRINGAAFTETTTKNANGEFTVPFVVPSGVTSFTIEAEVNVGGVWK